jgi:DNA-binding XRE family transcriptional regulator
MRREDTPKKRSVIAQRFRLLRKAMSLTQRQLGQSVGLCRQQVSQIENCLVTPHVSTWERFFHYEDKSGGSGITHLSKRHWSECLDVEDESATKGDKVCADS